MKSVSLEERRQLASTLVRRTHRFWMGSEVPMRWTSEDDRILAWYGKRMRIQLREEWEGKTLELYAKYIRDKRELMRAVRDELMLVFPGKSPNNPKKNCTFTRPFTVSTSKRLFGRVLRLGKWPTSTDFDILRPDSTSNEISLMGWLGIYPSSLTYWWEITEASIPATAKTVGDLCRHFIAAADHFLADPTDGSFGENETYARTDMRRIN